MEVERKQSIRKFSTKMENLINFLIIKDGKNWYYLAIFKLSTLFRNMLQGMISPSFWKSYKVWFASIIYF